MRFGPGLWYDLYMNGQLRLLLILGGLVLLFVFLQDKLGSKMLSIEERNTEVVKEEQSDTVTNIENSENDDIEKNDYVEVSNPNGKTVKVNVEVADTPLEKMNGLSKREFLGDYDGMWFVDTEDTQNPFWMPDMNFALDIIFVDSKGFIVDIIESAQPCATIENCPNLYPKEKYRFVLEVNAGFCKLHEIEIGHSIKQYF